MAQVSQMDLIKAEVEYSGEGLDNKGITNNILNEWRRSQKIEDMKQADMYLLVKNTAIDSKTRAYTDPSTSETVENDTLSNVKTKTAQYRKSVNQKFNFSIGKPFIISCDDEKYKEEWNTFLNDKMRGVIQRVGRDGINKGIGWAYPFIDSNGDLKLVDVKPETIYPAWSDSAHTELDAIVRDYVVTRYGKELEKEDVRKVEYWDKQIVEKFIDNSTNGMGGGELTPDTSNGEYELSEDEKNRATIKKTHLSKKDGNGISWERVPFIFFKGNMDELPLLNECKTDVDSYDMLKSKSIDSLIDDIDPTIVIRGISAEMGELHKARALIQKSRIMAVDSGGGADVLKTNTDISQVVTELELLRKDTQENTSTVDLTTIQLGTNPSGVSMKSFFESLNIWCNGFEAEFRIFMENLKYFFDKWLEMRHVGTFDELQKINVTFSLDRDMMINESEIIQNVVSLNGLISQQTLDEMNPWVENPEIEAERRADDDKKALERAEMFQFQQQLAGGETPGENPAQNPAEQPNKNDEDEE